MHNELITPIIHGLNLKWVNNWYKTMDDIDYFRIRVIYVLRPCVVGFALRNVCYIFHRKIVLVVFNIFVACHNFKTIVRNYSVVRWILLIAMLV